MSSHQQRVKMESVFTENDACIISTDLHKYRILASVYCKAAKVNSSRKRIIQK